MYAPPVIPAEPPCRRVAPHEDKLRESRDPLSRWHDGSRLCAMLTHRLAGMTGGGGGMETITPQRNIRVAEISASAVACPISRHGWHGALQDGQNGCGH